MGSVLVLLMAAWISSLGCAAGDTFKISDSTLGPRFDGVGAISGGGATSRLLPSYEPSVLSEILDFLFRPNFGASLQWLKVEIGGEALATEGSEPTHARTLEELRDSPNYDRGYEWMLMVEAKKRNPGIKLYGLAWTWPGYLGTSNPWADPALTANYSLSWVQGAKTRHGLDIDVIGVWNERSFSADFVKALRKGLDQASLVNTAILCDDAHYACAPQLLTDKVLAEAVTYVGGHGIPPDPSVTRATGKPVWFSEDFHSTGGEGGAAIWANQINNRYIIHNMTATLAWNAVDAFYPGLAFDNTGLMNARCPWAGNYEVLATIWATAHTTQFTAPGWHYLPVGTGAGNLSSGGSYVAYVADAAGGRRDFTVVIEKFTGDGSRVSAELATFCLSGSLIWAAEKPLNVWWSSYNHGGTPVLFERVDPVTPDAAGCFVLNISVDSLTTITTLSTGSKGSYPQPPDCQPFPLPYTTNFESCVPPAEADYFSDISGSWECVDDKSAHGIVMRLQTPARPVSWESLADTVPVGVLGDRYWTDVNASLDVRFDQPGDSFMLAVRANLANKSNYAALQMEYIVPGLWLSWNTSGMYTVWTQASHGTLLHTGTLPTFPAVGAWHSYSLAAVGDRLAATMDGVPLFSMDVGAQAPSGWVGYGSQAWGYHAVFDNFSVRPA